MPLLGSCSRVRRRLRRGSLSRRTLGRGSLRRLHGRAGNIAGQRVLFRRPVERGTWPLHSRIGNAVVAARLRRRYDIPIHDLGAMRVVRRQALLDLGVGDRRSGYPLQLLILAGRAHWRITECDITYRPRTAGSSKVSGSVQGTLRAVHDFWRVMR